MDHIGIDVHKIQSQVRAPGVRPLVGGGSLAI
jgi:hypothetical protein